MAIGIMGQLTMEGKKGKAISCSTLKGLNWRRQTGVRKIRCVCLGNNLGGTLHVKDRGRKGQNKDF